MPIKWTKRAPKNLETILAHIGLDDFSAAQRFLATTLEQVESLQSFPNLGRTGVVPATRELVIHENYIVFYRARKSSIEILRVLHAKREYP